MLFCMPSMARMMTAGAIPSDMLHHVWHELWPLLEPAAKRSANKPDVLADLLAQRTQLWAVYEDGKPVAAIVTKIIPAEPEKKCLLWLIGGCRAAEWLPDFMPKCEAWARSLGCVAIWASGRKGWDRLIRKWGAQNIGIVDGTPAWELRIT
jgi:hypothetical protein